MELARMETAGLVQDEGKGIPEHILRQLRSGQEITTKTFGNGIGVSSTFEWAKDRDYEVTFESSQTESKHGTAVSISIPATFWLDEVTPSWM
jgi:nitrogen-specific signal transduction histidine kinase